MSSLASRYPGAHQPRDYQPVAVAVIPREGSVLLVHRRADDNAPPWVLPGGTVEPGESAVDAAVRETLEETGLTVAAHHLLGSRVHPASRRELHYVACDPIAGNARVASTDEIDAVEWVPIEKLGEYVPQGFFKPVQRYIDAELARRHAMPGHADRGHGTAGPGV